MLLLLWPLPFIRQKRGAKVTLLFGIFRLRIACPFAMRMPI